MSAEFSRPKKVIKETERREPFSRIPGEPHSPTDTLPIGIFASAHIRLAQRAVVDSGPEFSNPNLPPQEPQEKKENRITVNVHGTQTVTPFREVVPAEIKDLTPGHEGADAGSAYLLGVTEQKREFFARLDQKAS